MSATRRAPYPSDTSEKSFVRARATTRARRRARQTINVSDVECARSLSTATGAVERDLFSIDDLMSRPGSGRGQR